MAKSDALTLLSRFHSWELNKISTTTFPGDVVATVRRSGQPMSPAEAEAVVAMVRGGHCYRCRIGKGRFFFGVTPGEAAGRAVDARKAHGKSEKEGT